MNEKEGRDGEGETRVRDERMGMRRTREDGEREGGDSVG